MRSPRRLLPRRRNSALLPLLALAGAPTLAHAQAELSLRNEPPAPVCVPAAWAVRDTIDMPVLLRVRAFDAEQGVPDEYLDRGARAIAARLAIPRPLAPRVYGASRIDDTATATPVLVHPVLYAVVRIVVPRDGGRAESNLATTSFVESVDQALMAAVAGADSGGAFVPWLDGMKGKSADLRIELSTADSSETPKDWIVVGSIRAPRFGDWQRPLFLPAHGAFARYPDKLRSAGLEGSVIAQFTVGVNGRIDARGLRIIKYSHPEFARSVYESLPTFKWRPGEVAGCTVPIAMRAPYTFNTSEWVP